MSETGDNTVMTDRLPKRLVLIGGVLLAICIAGGLRDSGGNQ